MQIKHLQSMVLGLRQNKRVVAVDRGIVLERGQCTRPQKFNNPQIYAVGKVHKGRATGIAKDYVVNVGVGICPYPEIVQRLAHSRVIAVSIVGDKSCCQLRDRHK